MAMIGLLGGTFNPPHLGHIREAKLAFERLGLERVIFMPANLPPHKNLPEGTPGAKQRFDMIALAARGLEFAEVSRIELEREGQSFTIDTVGELESLYSGRKIVIICGSDMMVTLENWRRGDELMRRCVIAAFARGIAEDELMLEKAGEFRIRYGADIRIFYDEAVEISSSELRELIRMGFGAKFLPDGVLGYIIDNNLYGT